MFDRDRLVDAAERRRHAGGDQHYPVLVQLDRTDPGLRPGMSARLRFARG